MNEELDYYTHDRSHLGEPLAGSFVGSAGGAACGDLVRISLRMGADGIAAVRTGAEGCAAARAAIAACAELVDGAPLLDAARLGADEIATELGGLGPGGRHGADLAADALHRALGALAASGRKLLAAPAEGDSGRLLVAMSGGVDSAVALHLARERGHQVVAVTLELWSDPANDGEQSCCSAEAVRLARGVAHSMGAPHLTLDLRERFRAGVVEPFLEGYAAASTPNPCVRCNGRVRLEPMIELAGRLGCEGLATGHYARVRDDGEGPLLAPAADAGKDQTYMLSALPERLLERMRFPLAELDKREVREIASRAGIAVANRAESQDLCFLAGVGKSGFLARHGGLGDREGPIVDRRGRRLGSHSGHHNFTVGQRKGIGLASAEPLYVLETDAERNRVVVGSAEELQTREVSVRDGELRRPAESIDAVRLRYRSPALRCHARRRANGGLELELAEPSRRPAPGQTAVLLSGELIVGHGTIE